MIDEANIPANKIQAIKYLSNVKTVYKELLEDLAVNQIALPPVVRGIILSKIDDADERLKGLYA